MLPRVNALCVYVAEGQCSVCLCCRGSMLCVFMLPRVSALCVYDVFMLPSVIVLCM